MWRDVCVANRAALLDEIDGYTAVLARLRSAIEAGDGATLEAVFARSRAARSEWQERATPTQKASPERSATDDASK